MVDAKADTTPQTATTWRVCGLQALKHSAQSPRMTPSLPGIRALSVETTGKAWDFESTPTSPPSTRKGTSPRSTSVGGNFRRLSTGLRISTAADDAAGLAISERLRSQVRSLEQGKHATLIVTDGDLFDTATHVIHAWVQGRKVDLSDRHKRLYRKYQERQKQTASQ